MKRGRPYDSEIDGPEQAHVHHQLEDRLQDAKVSEVGSAPAGFVDQDNALMTRTPPRKRARAVDEGEDERDDNGLVKSGGKWINRILSYFSPRRQPREEEVEIVVDEVDEDELLIEHRIAYGTEEQQLDERKGSVQMDIQQGPMEKEEQEEQEQEQVEKEEQVEGKVGEQGMEEGKHEVQKNEGTMQEDKGEAQKDDQEARRDEQLDKGTDVDSAEEEGKVNDNAEAVSEEKEKKTATSKEIEITDTNGDTGSETQEKAKREEMQSRYTPESKPESTRVIARKLASHVASSEDSALASPSISPAMSSPEDQRAHLLMSVCNIRWLFIRNDLHGALDCALQVWRQFDAVHIDQPDLHRVKNVVFYDMNEIVHELIDRKLGTSGVAAENRHIVEALVLFERKNVSAAMKQLRKVIAGKKETSKHVMSLVHYLLAQCLINGGGAAKDSAKAMRNIQRAIELDPRPMYLLLNFRGACHFNDGNYVKAIEDYNAAIKMLAKSGADGSDSDEEEFDVELYFNRAEAYFMLGEHDKAEKDVQMVVAADRTDKDARELLKKIQVAKKRKQQQQRRGKKA